MSARQPSLQVLVEQVVFSCGDAHRAVLERPSTQSVAALSAAFLEAGGAIDEWLTIRLAHLNRCRALGDEVAA